MKNKIKNSLKVFFKPFLVFFVLSLLLCNWVAIDWQKVLIVSNYQFIWAYAQSIVGVSRGVDAFENTTNFIKISDLDIKAPITWSHDAAIKVLNKNLESGVLHYPSSSQPGQIGTAVILGHSAPDLWPDIRYDKVFNEIDNLKTGDQIVIYWGGFHYFYQVNEKFFPAKGEKVINNQTNNSELILITCWPQGNPNGRLAIRASLIQ